MTVLEGTIVDRGKNELLTATESARRAELEATIETHINGFREAGEALAEIRDSRLYRNTHKTFEDYCKGVWQIARQTAYQLMDAAVAAGNVRNCGHSGPSNEAQARPLTKLPPEQQADAWKEAVETAPDGKVTAAHVAEVVKRRTGEDDAGEEAERDWSAPEGFAYVGKEAAKKKQQHRGSFDAGVTMLEAFKQVESVLDGIKGMVPKKSMATEVAGRARRLAARLEGVAKGIEKGL